MQKPRGGVSGGCGEEEEEEEDAQPPAGLAGDIPYRVGAVLGQGLAGWCPWGRPFQRLSHGVIPTTVFVPCRGDCPPPAVPL